MNVSWYIVLVVLQVVLQVHRGQGVPVLQEMMSKMLGADNPISNALDVTRKQAQAGSRELQLAESPRSSQQQRSQESSGQQKTARSVSLPPLLRARPPVTPRPPTALDINRGFGRVLSVVSILGQVDSYIAERARALVRKLLLLVDDDAANQIPQY